MIGTYYQTIYRNQQTGETVFYIVPKEKCDDSYLYNGLLKCSGVIGIVAKGTPISLEGAMKGKEFHVSKISYTEQKKDFAMRLLEFIDSSLTEKQMEAICSETDNNLFHLLEKQSSKAFLESLLNKRKDKKRVIKKILSSLRRLRDEESITLILLQNNIPLNVIEEIYKSKITYSQLLANPYYFLTKYDAPIDLVDSFAMSQCEVEEYSLARIKAFVYAALQSIYDGGNTCCTLQELTYVSNVLLKNKGFIPSHIPEAFVNLCVLKMDSVMQYHTVNNKSYIYKNHIWDEETKIITHLKRLNQDKKTFQYNVRIEDIEKKLNITYKKDQRNAFKLLNTSGVKILTGPPGSGKTALINGLIEAFTQSGCGVVKLAATTGTAAKVMSRACGRPSQTVNKLLDVYPFQGDRIEGRNQNNPVEANLLIVDESSFLGVQLSSILFEASMSNTIVLLVGDEHQLQSVEYGNVLHDLMNTELVEVYRLTEIVRQTGSIVTNALAINQGKLSLEEDEQFTIIRYSDPEQVKEMVRKNTASGFHQLLTPVRQSELGTYNFNQWLQPKNTPVLTSYGKTDFRKNDRVIITKTDYKRGYTNGDIGCVTGFSNEELTVQFPDKTLQLSRQDFPYLELAYAVTIHKSQGSEYENVHVILPKCAQHMITRRLLYTAVTRAKKHVFIYTTDDLIPIAIQNTKEHYRRTLLKERLGE